MSSEHEAGLYSLDDEQRIEAVLGLFQNYGQIDGSHHKAWVIDRAARILLGPGYEQWVEHYRGDDEYEWDEGIAP